MPAQPYQRQEVHTLLDRLSEPPRFLIFVAGPRQVGKTTLVHDALSQFNHSDYHFVPVDQPDESRAPGFSSTEDVAYDRDARPRDVAWLVEQWQRARAAARESTDGHILVLDEIQKISRWSEAVKGLWDADRAEGLKLHVVLLGSSPLLMQKGMSESLTGRYELIRITHWS
ncbi:MAG: AAA family ATPase, partial [Pseudomonadota bacterium]